MCDNESYKRKQCGNTEQIPNRILSTDRRLQFTLREGGIVSNRGSAHHGELFGALHTPPVKFAKLRRLEETKGFSVSFCHVLYSGNLETVKFLFLTDVVITGIKS